MNINIDELRDLSLQELVELTLTFANEPWFWFLTGSISAKLLDIEPEFAAEKIIPLFEAAHTVPADYIQARQLLQDWWKP